MLYICHFFCLRVYALHFRGKEKHIPKLDVMTFHSHPPIRISRLSSEAGWCPSGRVFGGSVEASWHHLQSFATTLGWGALGGGHNSWSPKKKGWSGSAQVTKGSELSLQWMMICWFIVKGVGALGILGLSFGQKFGLKFTLIHIPCQQLQVSEGFRRFPKVSEGFRTPCSTYSERWFSLFLSTMRCGCFRAHRRGWAEIDTTTSFFWGMWISRWWLLNSWTILGPKWTIFYGMVLWIKRRRTANESDASHPLVSDALQSMP